MNDEQSQTAVFWLRSRELSRDPGIAKAIEGIIRIQNEIMILSCIGQRVFTPCWNDDVRSAVIIKVPDDGRGTRVKRAARTELLLHEDIVHR